MVYEASLNELAKNRITKELDYGQSSVSSLSTRQLAGLIILNIERM